VDHPIYRMKIPRNIITNTMQSGMSIKKSMIQHPGGTASAPAAKFMLLAPMIPVAPTWLAPGVPKVSAFHNPAIGQATG
jgi:hypothetical protein